MVQKPSSHANSIGIAISSAVISLLPNGSSLHKELGILPRTIAAITTGGLCHKRPPSRAAITDAKPYRGQGQSVQA